MAASGIPKIMNVTPQILGVNEFIKDTKSVGDAAEKMASRVGNAIKSLNNSSASVGGVTKGINGLNTSFRASITGLSNWSKSFDATNNVITRFGSGLFSLGRNVSRISYQIERAGRGLFLAFTVPFIAFSTGMISATRDFEAALVRVENLVGVNQKVVERWGQEILKSAASLGATPVKMAEGLFAAASGFGQLAAQAPTMEVLFAATKAWALGLGEIPDIARAATAQINAFGEESLTAEQSVSLLVLGVREGNVEIDKLASAVGNVLGVASTMGASADDVLAFVAAYTRFGVAPTRAVTALNAALSNLLKPSKAAQEILEGYGFTIDEIKKKIAGPSGLANLFIEMRNTIPEEQFVDLFGVRALRGVLAVTGTDLNQFANEYRRIAQEMQNETQSVEEQIIETSEKGSQAWKFATGEMLRDSSRTTSVLEESFARVADTLDFKIERIKGQIQTIFIGTNAAIAPFLKEAADAISDYLTRVEEFIRNNQETTRLILKMAAGFALLGPAAMIAGRALQFVALGLEFAGGFISLFGKGIGVVLNFAHAVTRMAVVVGTTAISALFSLGSAAYAASAAITGFLIRSLVQLSTVIISGVAYSIWGGTIAVGNFAFALVSNLFPAIGAVVSGLTTLLPILAGSGAAIAVVGTAALAAVGGLFAFGDSIKGALGNVRGSFHEVSREVSGYFDELIPQGKTWGQGLMQAFSDGILDGIIYIVNSLNALGNWIADWLAPGSPPKILPEIDQWGTKTMQEWINGWKEADFGIFNDIFSNIETFLRATIPEDDEGLIPKLLLGTRGFIADAVNQIRELGRVSRKTLNDLYSSIGSTTAELQAYIEATLAATKAAQALADAQERINDINKKYEQILKPIEERLAEINKQGEKIGSEREVDALQRIISAVDTPERVRQMAQLRIQEITLTLKQSDVEAQRDAELSAAERQLEAAQAANDAAQEQLLFAKEALALQMKGYNLLAEILAAMKDVKDKLDKIKKLAESFVPGEGPGGFGEGINLPEPEDWFPEDGEGPLGEFDQKLKELQESITTLGVTWGNVWTGMTGKFATWKADIVSRFNGWKADFGDKWGPTMTAIEGEGRRTWDNLKTVLRNFWNNTAETRENINTWFTDFGDWLSTNAPTAIETFSDWVNETLIAKGLVPLSEFLTDEKNWDWMGSGGRAEDDPILGWLRDSLGEGSTISNNVKILSGRIIGLWNQVAESAEVKKAKQDAVLPDLPQGGASTPQEAIDNLKNMITPVITGAYQQLLEASDTLFNWREILLGPQHDNIGQPGDWWEEIKNLFRGTADEAEKSEERINTSFDSMALGVGGGIAVFDMFSDRGINLWGVIDSIREKANLLRDEAIVTVTEKIGSLITKIDSVKNRFLLWKLKIMEVHTWIKNLVSVIKIDLMTALTTLWNYLTQNINVAFASLKNYLSKIWEIIKEGLVNALDRLNSIWETMTTRMKSLFEKLDPVVSLFERLWQAIKNLPSRLVDWILDGNDPDQFRQPKKGGENGGNGGTGGTGGVTQSINFPTFPTIPIANTPVAAPPIVIPQGATVAVGGGNAISIGPVIIQNEMDMATFEARVRNVITSSFNT